MYPDFVTFRVKIVVLTYLAVLRPFLGLKIVVFTYLAVLRPFLGLFLSILTYLAVLRPFLGYFTLYWVSKEVKKGVFSDFTV
jgi:hypothetical protein